PLGPLQNKCNAEMFLPRKDIRRADAVCCGCCAKSDHSDGNSQFQRMNVSAYPRVSHPFTLSIVTDMALQNLLDQAALHGTFRFTVVLRHSATSAGSQSTDVPPVAWVPFPQ